MLNSLMWLCVLEWVEWRSEKNTRINKHTKTMKQTMSGFGTAAALGFNSLAKRGRLSKHFASFKQNSSHAVCLGQLKQNLFWREHTVK